LKALTNLNVLSSETSEWSTMKTCTLLNLWQASEGILPDAALQLYIEQEET